MPKGGHARSGPPPDPNSGRSDRRGLKFTALPAEGYQGPIPSFPLPRRTVFAIVDKALVVNEQATESVAERESELWRWAWRTPQACAWSRPSESWRLMSVAMWVRTFVLCESSEATAADKNSLHRFADQIGLSPAGLKENGWAVAKDELSEKAEEKVPGPRSSSRDRMKALPGGAVG